MIAPVRIESIAAGGDGVGRLADGRAVFVPRTAPGDLVELDRTRLRGRFARARIARLLESGPDRVEPPCAHYREDDCGGCRLQHLTPRAQEEARRRIAGDALRRIGKLSLPDPPLEPSERQYHYRTRITLTLDRGGAVAGFHRLGASPSVFELRRCEIAEEALNDLLGPLRDVRPLLSPAVHGIALRVDAGGAPHAVLRGPAAPSGVTVRRMTDIFRRTGKEVSLWWHPRPGITRHLAGEPGEVPAGAFDQVHPAMGDRVRNLALGLLGDVTGRRVWDLYAGLGQASSRLADNGATVDSVELDRDAVAASARADPRPVIRRHTGKVEQWVGRLPDPDLVLANPPRTGLGPGVATALRARGPRRVVYVSCDPATLARDLAVLCAPPDPYHPDAVRGFDLFPQTAHVETVVALERR